jgi:membrane associated rhomboid family serine protease
MASQVIFLAIVILSAVINTSPDLTSFASLDVSLVMSGEIWRLITGHLTHLTWLHYALDAPVFLVVYLLYKRHTGGFSSVYLAVFSAIIVSVSVVSMGIHQVYGGLSGLSCAAISALLLKIILDSPRRILPYILALVFLFYLLFLQGNANGLNVAKEAHVAGTLSGVIFELIRRYWKLNQRPPSHLTKLNAAIPPR